MKASSSNKTDEKVRSIGIIVPSLNDAEYLKAFFESLADQPDELLVADGGSTDESRQVADQFKARWIDCPRGRGHQMARAVTEAVSDVLLFAHADMRLDRGILGRILDELNQTGACGGAIGSSFESQHQSMKIIEALNTFRAGTLGISFGDQGQFIRRTALLGLGGFPDMPLMEDVELSMRMKSLGRPLYLKGGLKVSARSWEGGSKIKRALLVIYLTSRYLTERFFTKGKVNTEPYYRLYYGKNRSNSTG